MALHFKQISSWRILLLAPLLCCLVACKESSSSKTVESEDVLLYQAKKHLQDGKYQQAVEPLTQLTNNYQVSSQAQVYRLELLHAQYKAGDYMDAIDTSNQYVALYPFEPNIDYAMFIKIKASLAEFNSRHWVPRYIRESYGYTDTLILDEAMSTAQILIASFPNSKFAAETRVLSDKMKEMMLKRNYHIASEYRKNHAYAASQKRLTDVIMNTDSPKTLKKSLLMLRDNYRSMKQLDDAQKIDAILKENWKK
jgi:outer membrane protein assembly factor BamD